MLAFRSIFEPALIWAFDSILTSSPVPISSFPFFEVTSSRSSQSKTIFFAALISTSPSPASIRSFLFLRSKVSVRFPDLSAMMIFSASFASSRTIWWPDFVWIFWVVFSSWYAPSIGASFPFQSAPTTKGSRASPRSKATNTSSFTWGSQ